MYGEHGISVTYLWCAVGLALLSIVATVVIVGLYRMNPTAQPYRSALLAAWLGWVVIPPLWFAFEYLFLFKTYGPPGSFEAFKYAQDVASKVWLSIAAALTVIVAK